MLEDPTIIHSFAAVGGASTLFVIFQMARGAFRRINSKRADAAQGQRNATAEYQDLKEAVDRLKALVPPPQPAAGLGVPPGVATPPWASVGSGSATAPSNG